MEKHKLDELRELLDKYEAFFNEEGDEISEREYFEMLENEAEEYMGGIDGKEVND